ncbi:MAG: hypothetical protein ACM3PY_03760 [Omnitrophica WOR_2 bacterium]
MDAKGNLKMRRKTWHAGGPAAGPLVVSQANRRYLTIASGDASGQDAVYLTGSHIWNNFQDGMGPGPDCAENPEQLDYEAYLAFLRVHGHNFIRLWRWEQFKSQAAGGSYHLCMLPQPWLRTGPGIARDGKAKFDLESFDPAYFDRLRERVARAGAEGIYVAVMLFEGWALHLSPAPDNVAGHPFYAENNINGIGITSIINYQALPLEGRIQALQEAYIRKVIDTVHDLPNVLYEVANESPGGGSVDQAFAQALGLGKPPEWGDSTAWQYWVIKVVKQYEQQKGYDTHPTGMTMQFPVSEQTKVNDPLWNSPADWISPGYDDEIFAKGGNPMEPGSSPSRWYADPPANDGRKVVITDSDHYAPGQGDALWAWKSFLRGHHPILMDFGIIDGVSPTEASPSYESFEPTRYAMGDTRKYAERMNLIAMQPRGELSSTGYALANPGEEYLVLQPGEAAEPFSVKLAAGSYTTEWYSLNSRETADAQAVSIESPVRLNFTAPFEGAGPAVLYLKKVYR